MVPFFIILCHLILIFVRFFTFSLNFQEAEDREQVFVYK